MLSITLDPGQDPKTVDGRRARKARTRDAVVDAILQLLREGHDPPTVDQVGERSGTSARSVFRHFDDIETLYAAAVRRQAALSAALFAAPISSGGFPERVSSLVAQRSRLWETLSPVRSVAIRLRATSPSIAAGLESSRRMLRMQLRDCFAAEFSRHSPEQVRDLLDALELATGWEAWSALRTVQRCSRPRAERVMERLVLALLPLRSEA